MWNWRCSKVRRLVVKLLSPPSGTTGNCTNTAKEQMMTWARATNFTMENKALLFQEQKLKSAWAHQCHPLAILEWIWPNDGAAVLPLPQPHQYKYTSPWNHLILWEWFGYIKPVFQLENASILLAKEPKIKVGVDLLSTTGTAVAGLLFSPSMISGALSP